MYEHPLPARHRTIRRWVVGLSVLATVGLVPLAASAPAVAATTAVPASLGQAAEAALASPATVSASAADLCARTGSRAGFVGTSLVTAVAVALAESNCNPSAYWINGPTAGCTNGSVDRGLWQINSCYHREVSRACAYDAQCNASAAYQISSHGTRFRPWVTYNTGRYRAYLPAAQAAVNRLR